MKKQTVSNVYYLFDRMRTVSSKMKVLAIDRCVEHQEPTKVKQKYKEKKQAKTKLNKYINKKKTVRILSNANGRAYGRSSKFHVVRQGTPANGFDGSLARYRLTSRCHSQR